MYLLGYDIGSSSVKASLVDAETGRCVSSAFHPKSEAQIMALRPGWAEQEPSSWWKYLKMATADVLCSSGIDRKDIRAIGISYQMHGLVCVDKDHNVLRPSIIWCDSRAVPYGQKAFDELGHERCLSHLLNSPGNFTASKLAWVKENEPEVVNMFTATLLWMDDTKLVQGRSFFIKIGTKFLPATIMRLKHKIDINSGDLVPAKDVWKNELAVCDIVLAEKTVIDSFSKHKALGCFILVDRVTNMTSACGIINHSLRRSQNLTWQKLDITERAIGSSSMATHTISFLIVLSQVSH